MNIFDSHCHLDDECYRDDIEDVLKRATADGITAMMIAGIDPKSSSRAVAMAETWDSVYASVGIHPHDAEHATNSVLEYLKTLSKSPRVKAWGEIGLDFNRMYSPREDQEHWFVAQLEMARHLDLPVILHERDSDGRLLEILNNHFKPGMTGVVHCFSGNRQELKHYLELGLYIGVTGIVTMKDRGRELRKLIPQIPGDRILVETDAPYLTPAPQKNKTRRNEPAFVRSVLEKVADVRGENPAEFAEMVWDNTCRLFRIES